MIPRDLELMLSYYYYVHDISIYTNECKIECINKYIYTCE